MTKVIDLSQEYVNQKTNKIEFVLYLSEDEKLLDDINKQSTPDKWDEIRLIQKDYGNFDLMFAIDYSMPSNNTLYLGKFNDGIV